MAIFDFTEASSKFTTVPPGLYTAVVDTVKPEVSKAGNPMLVWWFAITDDTPFIDANGKQQTTLGKKLRVHTILKGNTFMLLDLIKALTGLSEDKVRMMSEVNEEKYLGSKVQLQVIEKMFTPDGGEPRPQNEVKAFFPVRTGKKSTSERVG